MLQCQLSSYRWRISFGVGRIFAGVVRRTPARSGLPELDEEAKLAHDANKSSRDARPRVRMLSGARGGRLAPDVRRTDLDGGFCRSRAPLPRMERRLRDLRPRRRQRRPLLDARRRLSAELNHLPPRKGEVALSPLAFSPDRQPDIGGGVERQRLPDNETGASQHRLGRQAAVAGRKQRPAAWRAYPPTARQMEGLVADR